MRPHIVIPGAEPDDRRRRVRSRRVLAALGAAVVGAWMAALWMPGVGPFLAALAGVVGLVVLALAAVMGLGWLGFGLFALGDRLVERLRKTARWPSE